MLNPPASATAEVRAIDKLRTGDLRVLCGIKLHSGVELHNNELHLSEQ
jgi:hypothetical protein